MTYCSEFGCDQSSAVECNYCNEAFCHYCIESHYEIHDDKEEDYIHD